MHVVFKLAPILLAIFCFTSCGKCDCIDENISPNFINYDSLETDTIIIRKYAKNTNFTALIDTAFFDDKSSFRIKLHDDTLSFPYHVGNFSISVNYDWIFFLPSINRAIRISDIVSEKTSMPCGTGKVQCVNPIESLNIYGLISNAEDYNFYISK